eukprot:ANDGO_05048.mRNA.1 hypothetical protein
MNTASMIAMHRHPLSVHQQSSAKNHTVNGEGGTLNMPFGLHPMLHMMQFQMPMPVPAWPEASFAQLAIDQLVSQQQLQQQQLQQQRQHQQYANCERILAPTKTEADSQEIEFPPGKLRRSELRKGDDDGHDQQLQQQLQNLLSGVPVSQVMDAKFRQDAKDAVMRMIQVLNKYAQSIREFNAMEFVDSADAAVPASDPSSPSASPVGDIAGMMSSSSSSLSSLSARLSPQAPSSLSGGAVQQYSSPWLRAPSYKVLRQKVESDPVWFENLMKARPFGATTVIVRGAVS